jgi:hypothetical protein
LSLSDAACHLVGNVILNMVQTTIAKEDNKRRALSLQGILPFGGQRQLADCVAFRVVTQDASAVTRFSC